MSDLTIAGEIIVVTSITFAWVIGYVGRDYWGGGAMQLMCAFLMYGFSYASMLFLNPVSWLFGFFVSCLFFSTGTALCLYALHRFFKINLSKWKLFAIPLITVFLYVVLLDDHVFRVRAVSALFLACNIWMLYVLIVNAGVRSNIGAKLFILALLLVSTSMALRVINPNASLTMKTEAGGISAILLSYIIFLVAIQLKSFGFLLMCHNKVEFDLKKIVETDSLTGLFSRLSIMKVLAGYINKDEDGVSSLSVMMVDVDHFKRINDLFGHVAGDRVLQVIGANLLRVLKANDFVGRYGGEEFVVVCPRRDAHSAKMLAQILLKEIGGEIAINNEGDVISVTVSIGVYSRNIFDAVEDSEAILRKADAALYEAKSLGRNCYCEFKENMTSVAR